MTGITACLLASLTLVRAPVPPEAPPDPTARGHLRLTGGEGATVDAVTPGLPAARARARGRAGPPRTAPEVPGMSGPLRRVALVALALLLPAPAALGQSGKRPLFTDEQRQFWAFQPVKEPSVPVSREPKASAHPIDRFILAKLEAA